jgi:hypothetical protein
VVRLGGGEHRAPLETGSMSGLSTGQGPSTRRAHKLFTLQLFILTANVALPVIIILLFPMTFPFLVDVVYI